MTADAETRLRALLAGAGYRLALTTDDGRPLDAAQTLEALALLVGWGVDEDERSLAHEEREHGEPS